MLDLAVILFLSAATPADASVDWSEPPAGLEARALADSMGAWLTVQGERCRVHVRPGSFPSRYRVALTRSADAAVRRAVGVVGGGYARPVDVFFFDSRDELIGFAGIRATGLADAASSSVFLVANPDWHPFDTHEIAHVVSLNAWGEPAEPLWWIREGFAVYADGQCRESALDAIAAEYLRRGELPHARDLIHRFSEVGEMPGYLGSGSFVAYLVRTYGIDAVRRIWQEGGAAVEAVLGVDLDRLDAGWRDSLDLTGPPIPDAEWEVMMDVGCG